MIMIMITSSIPAKFFYDDYDYFVFKVYLGSNFFLFEVLNENLLDYPPHFVGSIFVIENECRETF